MKLMGSSTEKTIETITTGQMGRGTGDRMNVTTVSKQGLLQEQMRTVSSASTLMKSWRYIDFVNPKARLPSISLEWLFGARGLLAGRIMQLRATFSKGKSSFMYLQYASAQIMSNAFCFHIATEGAGSPADYIASFGCNPNDLMVADIPSLEGCFGKVDEVVSRIRHGFGGVGGPVKAVGADPLDPNMERPIVIGIDALDSVGSVQTLKAQEYFRDRARWFRETQTLVMLGSHETAEVGTGKKGIRASAGGDEHTLAQDIIGIHATYGVDLTSAPYWDGSGGVQVGDVIKMRTFRNKLSPRHRELDLYLVWDRGIDLVKTDTEFLMSHPASPFAPTERSRTKLLYRHSQGIACKPLSDTPFRNDEDFLRAFYGNTDLLMSVREKMRIRGCGFDFETQHQAELDAEDAKIMAELDSCVGKAEEPIRGTASGEGML
jgi:hypothetical protein